MVRHSPSSLQACCVQKSLISSQHPVMLALLWNISNFQKLPQLESFPKIHIKLINYRTR